MGDLYARPIGEKPEKSNNIALACLMVVLIGLGGAAFGLLLGAVMWR